MKESIVLGSGSEELRKTLLKHTSQSIADFATSNFAPLSDGSPSIFAFSKIEGYPVIIKTHSFYRLFECDPKSDCYAAVYVIRDDNLVRFAANTISNSFSPSKAKSIVKVLSKCITLKSLLNRSLSFGLKKDSKFNKNFPDLV